MSRADAVILNVTTPSVAPTADFKLRGYSNADKNQPPPPPKKKKKKKHAKRDLVPGYRHRTRILAWECLKRVHISAQRVLYFGTKCERCITFPRTTKEIGHVCRHAGYLFH